MISKGFIKSSLIYTLAGTLPLASAIILLPFYIENISTADYGALIIYLAVSLLIQILTTYSFDTSLYIHYHEYKKTPAKLNAFISSAFVLMLLIGSGLLVFSVVVGDVAFNQFFKGKPISFFPYGLMSVATGIFSALFKVHSNLLQSREKPEVFFWSNLVSFALIATFTILGLELYPHSLRGPITARLLAALLSGGWALGRIFSEFGWHFNFTLLRSSFQFNLYAFIYQLQQWVINYFDRFVMLFFLTLNDVGVYDFAIKCLLIIEFLLNGLHSSFFPKVVKIMMARDEKGTTPEVNRYYHGFTAVVMLLICLCIFVVPPAIDLFARKADYRLAAPYIPYIGLIYIFRAMRLYFAVPYSTLKYTKPLPLIYLAVVIIKFGLMWFLLSEWKIYGVIAASLVSAVFEVLLQRYFIKGKFHYSFNPFKIIIAPILLMLLILGVEPFVEPRYALVAHGGYLIFCVGLLWWVYRRELKYVDPLKIIH